MLTLCIFEILNILVTPVPGRFCRVASRQLRTPAVRRERDNTKQETNSKKRLVQWSTLRFFSVVGKKEKEKNGNK